MSFFLHGRSHWSNLLLVLLLGSTLASLPEQSRRTTTRPVSGRVTALPASEFLRMIREFSEEDGYFRSDNFTSNETSYLQVIDRFPQLNVSGGAYVGVGPEQNFTYIAKIRPQIAFIVDIRRQAMIQHLMYKAIFHEAETRAQFLSVLF